jgi:hypothetical protein
LGILLHESLPPAAAAAAAAAARNGSQTLVKHWSNIGQTCIMVVVHPDDAFLPGFLGILLQEPLPPASSTAAATCIINSSSQKGSQTLVKHHLQELVKHHDVCVHQDDALLAWLLGDLAPRVAATCSSRARQSNIGQTLVKPYLR